MAEFPINVLKVFLCRLFSDSTFELFRRFSVWNGCLGISLGSLRIRLAVFARTIHVGLGFLHFSARCFVFRRTVLRVFFLKFRPLRIVIFLLRNVEKIVRPVILVLVIGKHLGSNFETLVRETVVLKILYNRLAPCCCGIILQGIRTLGVSHILNSVCRIDNRIHGSQKPCSILILRHHPLTLASQFRLRFRTE